MTDDDEEATFIRGTDRLQRMLSNPDTAERVAKVRDAMNAMDRAYAMNLAVVRSAANLTQTELARRLGVGQAAVSKVERQDDWLLSTLAAYIRAAGAQQAKIVVTVNGVDIEFDLTSTESTPQDS